MRVRSIFLALSDSGETSRPYCPFVHWCSDIRLVSKHWRKDQGPAHKGERGGVAVLHD